MSRRRRHGSGSKRARGRGAAAETPNAAGRSAPAPIERAERTGRGARRGAGPPRSLQPAQRGPQLELFPARTGTVATATAARGDARLSAGLVLLCVALTAAASGLGWVQIAGGALRQAPFGLIGTATVLLGVSAGALLGLFVPRRAMALRAERAPISVASAVAANFAGAAILAFGLGLLLLGAGADRLDRLRVALVSAFLWPPWLFESVLLVAVLLLLSAWGTLLGGALLVGHGWHRAAAGERGASWTLWAALLCGVSGGAWLAARLPADGQLLFVLLATFLAGGLAVVQPQLQARAQTPPVAARRDGVRPDGWAWLTAAALSAAMAAQLAASALAGVVLLDRPGVVGGCAAAAALGVVVSTYVARGRAGGAGARDSANAAWTVFVLLLGGAVVSLAFESDRWRLITLAGLASAAIARLASGGPWTAGWLSRTVAMVLCAMIGTLLVAGASGSPGTVRVGAALALSGAAAVAILWRAFDAPGRFLGLAILLMWLAVMPWAARKHGAAAPSAANADVSESDSLARVAADLFALGRADTALLRVSDLVDPSGVAWRFDLSNHRPQQVAVLDAPPPGEAMAGARADYADVLAGRIERRLTGQARAVFEEGIGPAGDALARRLLARGAGYRAWRASLMDEASDAARHYIVIGRDVPQWLARTALPSGVRLELHPLD